jgi:hypothetical protein
MMGSPVTVADLLVAHASRCPDCGPHIKCPHWWAIIEKGELSDVLDAQAVDAAGT